MAAAIDSRISAPIAKRKTVPHDLIRNQLNTLLENELLYKKQIKTLEKESLDLTKAYEAVYDENKILRGLVEHGPDTAKIAQLGEENKKLRKDNQGLSGENRTLKSKIKGLEKKINEPLQDELDREWNIALESARRNREKLEEATKKARSNKPVKDGDVTRSTLAREYEEEREMTLRIETLEREIQTLQTNIKKMKTEWEHICFSRAKDKVSMTKNVAVANAINEKLSRDIYRFELRLNKLKKKHTTMATEQSDILHKNPLPSLDEAEKTEPQQTTDNTDETFVSKERDKKENKSNQDVIRVEVRKNNKLPKIKHIQNKPKINKTVGFNSSIHDESSNPSTDAFKQDSELKEVEHHSVTSSQEGVTKAGVPGDTEQPLTILTRQEVAERKAIMRRKKKEELEAKKILQPLHVPPYKQRNLKRAKEGSVPKSRYLRPKQRNELYRRHSLGRSLDELSDEQTGSPIPIEFKEMDKFVNDEHVRLVLKRWDMPVYEVDPVH